jgi:hypothetical protein
VHSENKRIVTRLLFIARAVWVVTISTGASNCLHADEKTMLHTSRNIRTAAKFAGTILITALIAVVTAAADDISMVSVTNSGKLPLRVVILSEPGFGELGRSSSPDFISASGGNGKITLKNKVNKYHWAVFAKGPDGRQDGEPCDSDHRKGVSASSITVGCDHTIAEQKRPPAPPPATASPPANHTVRASFSNVSPRPDDLKAMNLKESDAEMTVEFTDLVAKKTQTFPLPVGVKDIVLTLDASGNAHLTYKVSFLGVPCFSGSADGTLGN